MSFSIWYWPKVDSPSFSSHTAGIWLATMLLNLSMFKTSKIGRVMIKIDKIPAMIEGTLGFLSSHPATEERIEILRALWENSDDSYRNLDEPFKELKTAVEQFVLGTNKESTEDESNS